MTSEKKTPQNPHLWVVDSIMEEPSYIDRAWFGCRGIYLHGRLMLVLCSGGAQTIFADGQPTPLEINFLYLHLYRQPKG